MAEVVSSLTTQTLRMDDSNAGTIIECQKWIDTGYYARAVTGLRSIVARDGKDPAITFKLAETLMIQGYYAKCLNMLSEFLEEMGNMSFAWKSPLVMIRCLVSAVVTGKFHASLQDAEAIYTENFPSNEVNNLNEEKVSCIESS